MRHLYQNETDTYSAESASHAFELLIETTGDDSDQEDFKFNEEHLADEKPFSVGFDDECDLPEWATKGAYVERNSPGCFRFLVTAPAHIWAKNEVGLVGSSEY